MNNLLDKLQDKLSEKLSETLSEKIKTMSFLDALKNKTKSKFDELEKISIEDWKTNAPEGFDFEFKDDKPKQECPRCQKLIPIDIYASHTDSHSSQIFDNLFLGGDRNAKNQKEIVDRTNIKHVINVAFECSNHFPDIITYHRFPLSDSSDQDIRTVFLQTNAIIEEAKKNNQNVLVHCIQGISRSASIVIAYVMKSQGWTLKESYEFVLGKRSIIKPNKNFINQLREYEFELYGKNTLTVEDVHTIEQIQN